MFRCFHGASALAVTTLQQGGDGVVSAGANVPPGRYARVYAAAGRGDWEAAREEQTLINRVWDALNAAVAGRAALTAPNVAAMKTWLRAAGIIDHDAVRAPAARLDEDERRDVERAAQAAGAVAGTGAGSGTDRDRA